MSATANFLAIDLGAESGRCTVGCFDGGRLSLHEVHRFPNSAVPTLGRLEWDALRIFTEIKAGIGKAVQQFGPDLKSLALDAWGVDFALLDDHGELLGNPYSYRDPQTQGMLDEALRRVPVSEIYAETGNCFSPINTLYQLLALTTRRSPRLAAAHTLLMVPDLFNYWLTGSKVAEYTEASTTQFLDPYRRDWNLSLLERLGIRTDIFPEIVHPGSALGKLVPDVADETGAKDVRVFAPASHDNASAVATIACESESLITSGTWCTLGMELQQPLINERTLAGNFTNEGGVCDTITLFRLITGLWLIQECRRTWAGGGRLMSYDEICDMAETAPPFVAVIDVDAPDFLGVGHMPERIQAYCRRTGQAVPETPASIARTIFESLALKFHSVFGILERVVGSRLNTLQIIGGGALNCLLDQYTADAINRPVCAGPVEATTVGNLLMQLMPLGYVGSLAEGRELVKVSFPTTAYEPLDPAAFHEPYERLVRVMG